MVCIKTIACSCLITASTSPHLITSDWFSAWNNHFWFICFHYVISACCLVSPSTHRTTKHECCLLSRHILTWGLLSIQLISTRFPLDLQLHINTNPHTHLPINTFRGTVFSRTLSRLSKPHLCWRWPLDNPAHGKGDQGDFTPSTLFFRSISFP